MTWLLHPESFAALLSYLADFAVDKRALQKGLRDAETCNALGALPAVGGPLQQYIWSFVNSLPRSAKARLC